MVLKLYRTQHNMQGLEKGLGEWVKCSNEFGVEITANTVASQELLISFLKSVSYSASMEMA